VLGKTLGVPLFQEQAMKLAIVAARFTPAQADGLRRAMATFRNRGTVDHYREQMVGGMTARGYSEDFAERCFEQIRGFGEYGFPESHAQAFAWLAYVSSWLKCHHPAVFTAALLNSQPMGFYAPAQLVRDARDHGVEVRAIDANASMWDSTLEPRQGSRQPALRLGFSRLEGFRRDWAQAICAARQSGAFGSMEDLAGRASLPRRRCASWPMAMRLARWGSPGARRCGRRGAIRQPSFRFSRLRRRPNWPANPMQGFRP
jgi:error-prone DNA polymerase